MVRRENKHIFFSKLVRIVILGLLTALAALTPAYAESQVYIVACSKNSLAAVNNGIAGCSDAGATPSIVATGSNDVKNYSGANAVEVTVDCGSSKITINKGANIKFGCEHGSPKVNATSTNSNSGSVQTPPLSISSGNLPHVSASSSTFKTGLSIFFGIIGGLALLMITISGLRYITSAGDPQKAANARSGVIYALVGLAVAISAEAIVAFVVNRL